MSSPSITLNLFKLKKNKRSREDTPVSSDPEILALLNQIDLGDQQDGTSVPVIPTNSGGVVDPRQVRPIR